MEFDFNALTTFDLIVLGIVLISVLVSLMRGALAEILSIVTWVGAVLAALYAGPQILEPIQNALQMEGWIPTAIAYAVPFIVALIVLRVISDMILGLRSSGAGFLDRLIGIAFGVLRGVVIVVIVYMLLIAQYGRDNMPEWVGVGTSQTIPYIHQAHDWFVETIPAAADLLRMEPLGEVGAAAPAEDAPAEDAPADEDNATSTEG